MCIWNCFVVDVDVVDDDGGGGWWWWWLVATFDAIRLFRSLLKGKLFKIKPVFQMQPSRRGGFSVYQRNHWPIVWPGVCVRSMLGSESVFASYFGLKWTEHSLQCQSIKKETKWLNISVFVFFKFSPLTLLLSFLIGSVFSFFFILSLSLPLTLLSFYSQTEILFFWVSRSPTIKPLFFLVFICLWLIG